LHQAIIAPANMPDEPRRADRVISPIRPDPDANIHPANSVSSRRSPQK